MKFLSWLFQMSVRHNGDARRYEKGGVFSRIFAMIVMVVLVGATVGVEVWSFSVYSTTTEGMLGGFLASFLALGLGISSIEYNVLYAYFGLKFAIVGTLESFIEKGQKKKNKVNKKTETAVTTAEVANPQNVDENPSETKKRKCPKWLDYFVGVFGIICAVGTVVAMVFVFVSIANNGNV